MLVDKMRWNKFPVMGVWKATIMFIIFWRLFDS